MSREHFRGRSGNHKCTTPAGRDRLIALARRAHLTLNRHSSKYPARGWPARFRWCSTRDRGREQPAAGCEGNHDPWFHRADGQPFDYQIGIALTVVGMDTGGPRVLRATFSDGWAKSARAGGFSPNPQTIFTRDIAEILVYSRVLTPQEEDQIRTYLTAKWGLQ